MTKSYADQCLERAERATEGPWEDHNWDVMDRPHVVAHSLWNGKDHCNGHFDVPCTPENAEFIAHSRTDVPELARRLNKACDNLHKAGSYIRIREPDNRFFESVADELEAPLEEK